MIIEIMPDVPDPVGAIVPVSDHSVCDSLYSLGAGAVTVGATEKSNRLPAPAHRRYIRLYGLRGGDSSAVAIKAEEHTQSVVETRRDSPWFFRYLMFMGALVLVFLILRELFRRR